MTPEFVEELRDWFEPRIEAALAGGSDLENAARYAMGWRDETGTPSAGGGKRLRPVLCLAVAEACGGNREEALPCAMAIEFVHNFSLVHDDVQDRDDRRHGRPTVWRIHGEGQAINVGDFLVTSAFRVLGQGTLPPERVAAALAWLGHAVGEMVEGQWTDLAFETWDEVTVDQYIHMVRGKTGALLGASAALGAIAAGANDARVRGFADWASTLGLAFQAHDDYLGIWGDSARTGKSTVGDIERGKKSLPLILAGADAAIRPRILEAAHGGGPDAAAIRDILGETGIRDEVRRQVDTWRIEADRTLGSLDLPLQRRQQLAEFSRYVIDRVS